MDRTLKQLLDKSIEDKMEWDTLCIPFPTKDGDVNLCDYIGLVFLLQHGLPKI
jgi:hypothetical protein